MNRLFKITVLFATVVGLSLLATETQANTQVKAKLQKHTTPITQTSNTTSIFGGTLHTTPSTQTANGTSIFGGTLHTTPTSKLIYHVPNGGWKALGGLFNQPTRTLPYHIPPGGWHVYGGLFGTQKPPVNPPKGNGMGHGLGGVFGGGTVVSTTGPVLGEPAPAAPTAPAQAIPAQADSDSQTDALQIAAGSTFTLKGEKFGSKQGQVGIVVGGILIPVEVTSWTNTAITLNLPPIVVESAAKATFVVERADGTTANQTKFELVAAK